MVSFNQMSVTAFLVGLFIVSFAWTKKITIPIGKLSTNYLFNVLILRYSHFFFHNFSTLDLLQE